MSTPLVLDPPEVSDSRVALDLNAGSIRVGKDGPDWGDAQIAAYMAEMDVGEVPVDFRLPNRQITIPLSLGASGPAGFAAARAQLQAKVALIQRRGGWLKRGTGLYADLVNATLAVPDRHGHLGLEDEVVLKLEAIPDFYGDEIALADHVETVAPCLIFTENGIQGDYPARARLVIDNDSAAVQWWVVWAVQSDHYSADPTAALFYEAESLTPLGAAAANPGQAGASGGGANKVIRRTDLPTSDIAVMSTQLAGGGAHLSHVGTYRVLARCHAGGSSSTASKVTMALEWGSGDLVALTRNRPVEVPYGDPRYGAWAIYDLGQVTLESVVRGAQRWQGQLLARGTMGTEDLDIDWLLLIPVDEGSGEIRASSLIPSPSSYSASDNFNNGTDGAALNGRTADAGGAWASSGDVDDFAIETTSVLMLNNPGGSTAQGVVAKRTAVSDANLDTGRYAGLGVTNYTDLAVQADLGCGPISTSFVSGQELRYGAMAYLDANNWLGAFLRTSGPSGTGAEGRSLAVYIRLAGVTTLLTSVPFDWVDANFHTLRLAVAANGRYSVYAALRGSELGAPKIEGYHPALETGGALASRKPYIYDAYTAAAALVREYDNVLAWTWAQDAAIHPGQSLEFRHDGVIHEDPTGAYWSKIHAEGDYFRLPPSGLESAPSRILVKMSRNDPANAPDNGIDDLSARVYYRPSWLTVPGG